MAETSPRDYFRTKKRYVQVGHLGRGGMAVVSESKDEYFQREIAYKKLKPGPGIAKRTEEFVREALIMGKLEHPGVVPIHELIEQPGDTAAITMNKVSGLSLAEKIAAAKKEPEAWPFEERIRQFQKLVEIVAYSHSRKIIHRDIKPANVMIGEFGQVILLDWGLAKVTMVKETQRKENWDQKIIDGANSVSGSIKGTPYYMSPEAAAGKTELVNEANDVFGLGAVLYEFITLSYLIKGNKAIDVLKHASQGDYHPSDLDYLNDNIKADVDKVPEELQYILRRAIQKDPAKRYPTATQFNQDLIHFLNEMPIEGFGSGVYKVKKWFNRNGLWLILMLLPVLLTSWLMGRLQKEQSAAEHALYQRDQEMIQLQQSMAQTAKKIKSDQHKLEDLEKRIENTRSAILKEEQGYLSSQDEIARKAIDLEMELRRVEEIKARNEIRRFDVEQVQEELDEENEKLERLAQEKIQAQRESEYQSFLENTFPYGYRMASYYRQVLAGKPLKALWSTHRDDLMNVDPYVGDWLKAWTQLSARPNTHVGGKEEKLMPLQMVDAKKMEKMFKRASQHHPDKNWSKVVQWNEQGLIWSTDGHGLLLEPKSRGVFIHPHESMPKQLYRSRDGNIFGVYGNNDLFVAKDWNSAPKVIQHTRQEVGSLKLKGSWLLVMNKKGKGVAYNLADAVTWWSELKEEPKVWLEMDDGMASKEPVDLEFVDIPAGYRVLNAEKADGPWLIGFISSLKSRFKNFDPFTGDRSELWSLEVVKPQKILFDRFDGWIVLGDDRKMYHFKSGISVRPMSPLASDILDVFKIDKWNLIVAQDETNRVHVYYLSTGQYLFSPGLCDGKITKVGVSEDEKMLIQLDGDRWISPKK